MIRNFKMATADQQTQQVPSLAPGPGHHGDGRPMPPGLWDVPPLNQRVHLVGTLKGTGDTFVVFCGMKNMVSCVCFFSSFKWSPDASVNACQGGAFWKQSYCWSPVPRTGHQWKQSWYFESQLSCLSCSREAVGVWVCVHIQVQRWTTCLLGPEILLTASLHPSRGPQPQMRSGSPICSLFAFKDNLGAPSQQIAPLENFCSCFLLAAQQRAYCPGIHLSCKQ